MLLTQSSQLRSFTITQFPPTLSIEVPTIIINMFTLYTSYMPIIHYIVNPKSYILFVNHYIPVYMAVS